MESKYVDFLMWRDFAGASFLAERVRLLWEFREQEANILGGVGGGSDLCRLCELV